MQPETDTPATPRRRTPWATMLISGLIAGVPTGLLLAYLAFLPFFLGLFFFMLFGLIIGAIMYRAGREAAPLPRGPVLGIGILVVIVVWIIGPVLEYRDLPKAVAEDGIAQYPRRLDTQEQDRLRAGTREHVDRTLRTDYPPGGFIGYLRWVITDGEMECPYVITDVTYTFRAPQNRIGWILRTVLSLVLLGFGILSQVLSLVKPPPGTPPPEEDEDQPGTLYG